MRLLRCPNQRKINAAGRICEARPQPESCLRCASIPTVERWLILGPGGIEVLAPFQPEMRPLSRGKVRPGPGKKSPAACPKPGSYHPGPSAETFAQIDSGGNWDLFDSAGRENHRSEQPQSHMTQSPLLFLGNNFADADSLGSFSKAGIEPLLLERLPEAFRNIFRRPLAFCGANADAPGRGESAQKLESINRRSH